MGMTALASVKYTKSSDLESVLAEILKNTWANEDNIAEANRIETILKFSETRYKQAYDWVYKQAEKGYEHQACQAMAQIDFARSAGYLQKKIVEGEHELNKNTEYPFNKITFGRILENLYQKEPEKFAKNYSLISKAVSKEFLNSALNFVSEPYKSKIARLLGIDYKNPGSRPEKRLS